MRYLLTRKLLIAAVINVVGIRAGCIIVIHQRVDMFVETAITPAAIVRDMQ
jgi:hypothetical protein